MRAKRLARLTMVLILCILSLSGSILLPGNRVEQVHVFTRSIEFDFIRWNLGAIGVKLEQAVLNVESYLPAQASPEIVLSFLSLVDEIARKEAEITDIYANPDISDPLAFSSNLREEISLLYTQRAQLQPLAESILQQQISTIAAEAGLGVGGQALPPVLFHITPPPYSLIVSPRDTIRQDANISVSPELTIDQIAELEQQVDESLDVSSLVVRIGGIGLYPTMVMQTTDINWLVETVAHEWIHNYLSLRPLGVNYMTNPQLRTMNETVAGLAGKELGQAVIARYYPDYLPPPPEPIQTPSSTSSDPGALATSQPPEFDFRAEMHTTRLAVDSYLEDGNIADAEAYMELRRQYFWEHGYHIRKLNQAYFAFHGAYADTPGGAAGASEDPVGNAVRTLRANSPSLAQFLKRIAWMWSFEQLQRAIAKE